VGAKLHSIAFKSSFGKFVGADLKDFRGINRLSKKRVCTCGLTAPLLSLPCKE